MNYLKDEQYYSNIYDLSTIRQCLISNKNAIKVPPNKPKGSKVKAISLTMDFFTYFIKGERFKNKTETINEWMRKDREKDEKVRLAVPPQNVHCDSCFIAMTSTMKDLHYDENRIMFWFECPNCKKRKAVFEGGQEYVPKPNLCPKCSSTVTETFKRMGETLITNIKCPNCGYKTKEIMDFEKDRKEWAEKQQKDKELLEKYRWKFCMSDKEGGEYISTIEQMKMLNDYLKEHKQKLADPAYQKAKLLKKLSVVELEKKLNEVLGKEKYIKLSFNKPEIGKYVLIPFTVQEADSKRQEYDSSKNLEKLIRKTLEDTNWRLMSGGIEYRLGYLSGTLKGYEREEDLMEIVRKRKENPPLITTKDGYIY